MTLQIPSVVHILVAVLAVVGEIHVSGFLVFIIRAGGGGQFSSLFWWVRLRTVIRAETGTGLLLLLRTVIRAETGTGLLLLLLRTVIRAETGTGLLLLLLRTVIRAETGTGLLLRLRRSKIHLSVFCIQIFACGS